MQSPLYILHHISLYVYAAYQSELQRITRKRNTIILPTSPPTFFSILNLAHAYCFDLVEKNVIVFIVEKYEYLKSNVSQPFFAVVAENGNSLGLLSLLCERQYELLWCSPITHVQMW